jgi:glycosyltransferase involved in cell wall biosynthesis
MLCIDVSAAVRSLKHTGVERLIRYFFQELCRRYEITPLVWDPFWKSYATLSPREKFFLTAPLLPKGGQGEEPIGLSFFLGELAQRWDHAYRRIRLEGPSQAGSYLFTLENLSDTRPTLLERLTGQGLRWVAFLHDLIPLHGPSMQKPDARQLLFLQFLQRLRKAYAVVCPSNAVREEYCAWCRACGLEEPSRLLVFPWPPSFPIPRPQLTPNFGSRRVLCVSSFNRRKNHPALLQACERLWNKGLSFQLVLVGRIGKGFQAAVEELRERCRREGWPVLWFHHVDDAMLLRLYQEASFTVFPSRDEGYGFPIVESTWLGRPCVCGSEAASGELASGGGCLAVQVEDPQELARAIEELLTNPLTYRKLFEECQMRAFFDWPGWMDAFLGELPLPRPKAQGGQPDPR